MNASRQKIIPWKAGPAPSSPGMKTSSVFREPALKMSSAEMKTKMPISMAPRITPVRVEIPIPLEISHQSRTPHRMASTTQR